MGKYDKCSCNTPLQTNSHTYTYQINSEYSKRNITSALYIIAENVSTIWSTELAFTHVKWATIHIS